MGKVILEEATRSTYEQRLRAGLSHSQYERTGQVQALFEWRPAFCHEGGAR
jgi:hypothetical protein